MFQQFRQQAAYDCSSSIEKIGLEDGVDLNGFHQSAAPRCCRFAWDLWYWAIRDELGADVFHPTEAVGNGVAFYKFLTFAP
jgi:hypothetical protein